MSDLGGPPVRGNSGVGRKKQGPWVLVASYALDWIVLIAADAVGFYLGNITPNRRPFSLQDPNISFPFTVKETVDSKLLLICNAIIPIVVILFVALVFVPGNTVPKGTPKSLIWKRKLWELHTGWLGLALSLTGAWFITSGTKNLCGKPRPDLLSRCQPDLDNLQQYIIGGTANVGNLTGLGQLVSANICKNPDVKLLEDGFRSYPSGHSSSSAAGLIYLSLFLASKFSVTIPFLASGGYPDDANAMSSFPSRLARNRGNADESMRLTSSNGTEELGNPNDPVVAKEIATHTKAVLAVRRQAAAPPIYLLAITCVPFFLAIFIASSRWFDFRHHGFDILFGFLIGTITAWFAFRYYHLPIARGAGWAWAPRSHDKAFWAGMGSYSYATEKKDWVRAGEVDEGFGHAPTDIEMGVRNRKPEYDAQNDRMASSSALGGRQDGENQQPPSLRGQAF
ncbi:lipid transporter atnI [Apiospora arundinis]|uniref:Acid phosphatase/Vanadium-dependent haloperoxidase n=1 Tax=Apiospora arundinis TaxID=335852 RepID=A0ABR2J6E8_9PEZI